MLDLQHVSGGYANRPIVHNLSFSVQYGEFFGILGPNGSGKTTLLKMISGLITPSSGAIRLAEANIASFSQKALARRMAVLPQFTTQVFSYTVRETIALGRYAHHQGMFQTWTTEDEQVLQTVMEQTATESFEHQDIQTLSGGEQQRVFLAQALAQQPDLLLLDEPTNHLDLAYQKELLDLLKMEANHKGLTVVSIFHDLNLASLYCNRLLLLHKGQKQSLDTPDGVLTDNLIQDVYRTHAAKQPHPTVAKPQIHLLPDRAEPETKVVTIDASYLHIYSDCLALSAPFPLRTLAYAERGSGFGWKQYFLNWHMRANTEPTRQHDSGLTVKMTTSVSAEEAVSVFRDNKYTSVFIVAIVSGNQNKHNGINLWLFINSHIADKTLIRIITAAIEVKTSVLQALSLHGDTGELDGPNTASNGIAAAAVQRGNALSEKGVDALEDLIRTSVYTAVKQVVENSCPYRSK